MNFLYVAKGTFYALPSARCEGKGNKKGIQMRARKVKKRWNPFKLRSISPYTKKTLIWIIWCTDTVPAWLDDDASKIEQGAQVPIQVLLCLTQSNYWKKLRKLTAHHYRVNHNRSQQFINLMHCNQFWLKQNVILEIERITPDIW